jgi:hypothetical protein
MSKTESYRKQQLPNYIERLKNMVALNFEIMVKPVDSFITPDKYYNVVKGRRVATEQSIKGLKKIDACYKELDNIPEGDFSSYYKETLPTLIEKLKEAYELNLEVIDIELEPNESDKNELYGVQEELQQIFGDKLANKILKIVSGGISEEKYPNVVKSREMAYEDCDWMLTTVEELESESNQKEEEVTKRSWAKRAAAANKK